MTWNVTDDGSSTTTNPSWNPSLTQRGRTISTAQTMSRP